MKFPLLSIGLLAFACSVSAQEIGTSRFRGDYFGVMLPAGKVCTTERLAVNVLVDAAGEMRGTIVDWDGTVRASIENRMDDRGKFLFATGTNQPPPFPDCFPFCPPEPGKDWTFKGSASASAGTLRGTVDGRLQGACKYTFVLYRRFKNN